MRRNTCCFFRISKCSFVLFCCIIRSTHVCFTVVICRHWCVLGFYLFAYIWFVNCFSGMGITAIPVNSLLFTRGIHYPIVVFFLFHSDIAMATVLLIIFFTYYFVIICIFYTQLFISLQSCINKFNKNHLLHFEFLPGILSNFKK